MQLSLSAAVVLWVKQKAVGLHYDTAFTAQSVFRLSHEEESDYCYVRQYE